MTTSHLYLTTNVYFAYKQKGKVMEAPTVPSRDEGYVAWPWGAACAVLCIVYRLCEVMSRFLCGNPRAFSQLATIKPSVVPTHGLSRYKLLPFDRYYTILRVAISFPFPVWRFRGRNLLLTQIPFVFCLL